MKSKSEAVVE